MTSDSLCLGRVGFGCVVTSVEDVNGTKYRVWSVSERTGQGCKCGIISTDVGQKMLSLREHVDGEVWDLEEHQH